MGVRFVEISKVMEMSKKEDCLRKGGGISLSSQKLYEKLCNNGFENNINNVNPFKTNISIIWRLDNRFAL